LGGLSFDEGQFSVFGYDFKFMTFLVTNYFEFPSRKREKVPMASCIISLYIVSICRYTTVGKDILSQIKTGDVIVSAKLVEGQDRLILPNES
jgi:hypothetical protein